jgi:hypothetical protein
MPTVPNAPNAGPYLGIAVFCEKVMQETGFPMSLIRITDTLTQAAVGSDAPRAMQPFVASITLVVLLRNGEARGQFGLLIRPEAPGGFQMPPFEQTFTLEGGEAWGHTVIVPMQFPVSQPGVYWFDLILMQPDIEDDPGQLLTRVPLEVQYQRAG